MSVYTIIGTAASSNVGGIAIGDTFTLTVTTDGRSTPCSVANGGLISITGTVFGSTFDITTAAFYPVKPLFDPATGALDMNLALVGGPLDGFLFGMGVFDFSAVSGPGGLVAGTFAPVRTCLL